MLVRGTPPKMAANGGRSEGNGGRSGSNCRPWGNSTGHLLHTVKRGVKYHLPDAGKMVPERGKTGVLTGTEKV